MSRWAAVRLIAGREIRDRLRGRALKISTVVSSAVVAAIIIIPSLQGSEGTPVYDVAVAGELDRVMTTSLEAAGRSAGAVVRVRLAADDERAEASVRAGTADVALLAEEIVIGDPLDPRGSGSRERVVSAISEVVRVRRVLEHEGINPTVAGQVLSSPPPPVRNLGEDEADLGERVAAFAGVAALLAFLQQYGSWVAYGVAEEKSTRIVEVLLSAVRPRELLAGKVLGVGAVALGQGLVVAATGLIALEVAGSGIPAAITPATILKPFGWFILGYAFYCWAFASAGALVARTADLQSTLFPVTLPILIAYFLSVSASFGGEPPFIAKVLAFVPPTAPMLMLTLSAGGHVESWQVALAAGITVVSTLLLARVAAAIYSRSILRTGKRVRWTEALRLRSA